MSGPAPYGLSIPEGLVWKYEQTWKGKRLEHTWSIRGEAGGIHVSAWITRAIANYPSEWIGGVEMHKPSTDEKADHKNCWLIGGPCEHDGSSLQFSEQIAPYLSRVDSPNPHKFDDFAHQNVLSVMLNRYRTWLVESDA